uniref:Zgc:113149 n=1 Tax=Amphilophus citrinellus TaxID=61819 RepID=A0A3Q0R6D3_AMPCI
MSATWHEDDEELKLGGVKGGLKAKPRFSFTEVKLLLEAVKRNRYIILRKFNQGVSAETKKQTWAEITNQINGLGENHREIMKKWADLKCDGKRRIAALRGPNGATLRKKKLGPVEKMVHKILMMSPRGGEAKHMMDFDENDDSMFSYPSVLPPPSTSLEPLPDDALTRVKPVYTYSRSNNGQSQTLIQNNSSPSNRPPPGPSSSSVASTSSGFRSPPPSSSVFPPSPLSTSGSNPSEPLPAGASSCRSRDQVAQVASQSLQQQRASRMLLTSVSQSLETLAQSVQLLVESQQEFVQESLQLQRETVDILRDFSNTALTMLRDKANRGKPANNKYINTNSEI